MKQLKDFKVNEVFIIAQYIQHYVIANNSTLDAIAGFQIALLNCNLAYYASLISPEKGQLTLEETEFKTSYDIIISKYSDAIDYAISRYEADLNVSLPKET